MQNLPLQLQSSILQHQLQSWLVHFAFFSRGHFWTCFTSHSGRFIQESKQILLQHRRPWHCHIKRSASRISHGYKIQFSKKQSAIYKNTLKQDRDGLKIAESGIWREMLEIFWPIDGCVGLADCGDEAVEKVCSLLWTSPRQFKHLDNHFSFQLVLFMLNLSIWEVNP